MLLKKQTCAVSYRIHQVRAAAQPRRIAGQQDLNRQIYLADDQFFARIFEAALPSAKRSAPMPRVHRCAIRTLADRSEHCDSREDDLRRAHVESGLSTTAMAAEFGLTVGRISQLIAKAEINAAKKEE